MLPYRHMRITCPSCNAKELHRNDTRTIYRGGNFYRKSDGQWIQRYTCRICRKTFSQATLNDCYKQNKRHKNNAVRALLCASVSQRESARILKLNRKTIVRKLLYLQLQAGATFHVENSKFPPCQEVEFDDLETFEHSKDKPLSVTLMVEYKSRRILGFTVSKMPAKGRLAKRSIRKYGSRPDERALGRNKLFLQVKNLVAPNALIRSDSNPHYTADVKRHFPEAHHMTVKGSRSAATGQGELKKIGFDPLFSLNHTFAMLRANINRLVRKTWGTTKRADRLEAHLMIYAMSHNRRLNKKRREQLFTS